MADNRAGHLPVRAQMREFHLAQQGNAVLRQCAPVNHPGVLKHFLQETDTADSLALGPSGGPVFEILAQVALSPCLGQFVLDPRIFHIDEIVEFSGYFVVSFF